MSDSHRLSYLGWYFISLGPGWALTLLIVSVVVFWLTVHLVERGRGGYAILTLILIVPIPFLLAVWGACDEVLQNLAIYGAAGISTNQMCVAAQLAMHHLQYGLLLMAPSLLWGGIGSARRSVLSWDDPPLARVVASRGRKSPIS